MAYRDSSCLPAVRELYSQDFHSRPSPSDQTLSLWRARRDRRNEQKAQSALLVCDEIGAQRQVLVSRSELVPVGNLDVHVGGIHQSDAHLQSHKAELEKTHPRRAAEGDGLTAQRLLCVSLLEPDTMMCVVEDAVTYVTRLLHARYVKPRHRRRAC